jgi:hypothetical protein
MTGFKDEVYEPNSKAAKTYTLLYGIYTRLHDAFGDTGLSVPLNSLMKDLIEMRNNA